MEKEDLERMIQDYQEGGLNLEKLAIKYHIGKPNIKKLLIENGVEVKRRGANPGEARNLKWTYEACKEEAKKYATIGEMYRGNGSAYNAALRNGWLDDFFERRSKPDNYWDEHKEEVFALAATYRNSFEFNVHDCGAYKAAKRNGWTKELKYNR